MSTTTLDKAREAKEKLYSLLKDLGKEKLVSGIGITKDGDDFVLKLNLKEPFEEKVDFSTLLPNIRVTVEVVGTIKFL